MQSLSLVSGKQQLSRFSYTYNSDQDIASVIGIYSNRSSRTAYDYDANQRLTNTLNTGHIFDLSNNLREEIHPEVNLIRIYNRRNELKEIINPASRTQQKFDYDAYGSGNLVNDLKNQYRFNALNELTCYNATRYSYNANGERLSKTIGLIKQIFYYKDENLVNQQDGLSVPFTSYVLGLNREAKITQQQPSFYNYNQHDDVIQVLNDKGHILAQEIFGVYGQKLQSTKASMAFSYDDYYLDSESNLYYLNARYYSPLMKTFISQDTYAGNGEPINDNRYLYGDDNPVMARDLSGHAVTWSSVITFFSGVIGSPIILEALSWGWNIAYVKYKRRSEPNFEYELNTYKRPISWALDQLFADYLLKTTTSASTAPAAINLPSNPVSSERVARMALFSRTVGAFKKNKTQLILTPAEQKVTTALWPKPQQKADLELMLQWVNTPASERAQNTNLPAQEIDRLTDAYVKQSLDYNLIE